MPGSLPAGKSGSGPSRQQVLKWGRWSAVPLALVLLVEAVRHLAFPAVDPAWFFTSLGVVEMVLAGVLLLPVQACRTNATWWRLFGLLLAVAILFTFGRVIGVLFEARAIEAAGGELGLPGWTGTLIFLVLAQVPIRLFSRFPDQLD